MSNERMFKYQALESQENTIRLLSLSPGQFSDDIHLTIAHENFPGISYECLSYTWGSETQLKEKVYIENDQLGHESSSARFLVVRLNLMEALRYIRLPDRPRVVWIDALCIDQQNNNEKAREVARMGNIYKNATQVLVWLGLADDTVPIAAETINRLSVGLVLSLDRRNCDTVPGSEAEVVRHDYEQSAFGPEHWISLSNLLKRPWFRRLWIRQEVHLATKVLVQCGYVQMDWTAMGKVIVFIEQKLKKTYICLEDVLFCRSLFPYRGSDSLVYTLHRSSRCGFSVARDVIYANLPTSSAMQALEIKPTYTSDTAEVFEDMVLKFGRRFESLDLLRLCDLQSLPLGYKSFVPNFAARKASDSWLFSVYAHAGTRQSFITTTCQNILVKGRTIGKVKYTSTHQKPITKDTLDHKSREDIINVYRQWEPEGVTNSTKYPLGGSLLDAFVMLLSNGFCKETYHLPHLPTLQESKETFLKVVSSQGDINLINKRVFKPYLDEVISDRRSEVFFQTIEGYIGTSPTRTQAGDIVSVLLGASVPILLRPISGSPDIYQVVGPCFLQGVMFGEGLLGPFPDNWTCIINDDRKWCFRNRDGGETTLEDPRLWPLPAHWRAHFRQPGEENGSCPAARDNQGDLSTNQLFFNTQSQKWSKDDPRLDARGLEAGGVPLQSFTLI